MISKFQVQISYGGGGQNCFTKKKTSPPRLFGTREYYLKTGILPLINYTVSHIREGPEKQGTRTFFSKYDGLTRTFLSKKYDEL